MLAKRCAEGIPRQNSVAGELVLGGRPPAEKPTYFPHTIHNNNNQPVKPGNPPHSVQAVILLGERPSPLYCAAWRPSRTATIGERVPLTSKGTLDVD